MLHPVAALARMVCVCARARAAHRPTIVLAQTVIARPVSAVRVDRACQRWCGCHVHVRMPRRAAGGTLRAARVAICVRGRGARSVPNFGQSPCACCCDHARRQNTDAALLHPEALPSDEYAALCEIVWPRVSSAERNRVLSVWFNQVRGLTDAVLWVWRPPPPVSDNVPSLCCSPATACSPSSFQMCLAQALGSHSMPTAHADC